MTMLLHALSLVMVVFMGFAAHRASLCTVRAVAEAMQQHRFDVLLSFVRAALWTAAIAGFLALAFTAPHPPILLREPVTWALAGGFLFGVGAAINDGCSLSTLQRLADGDLSMLLTLAGFCIGILAWFGVEAAAVPVSTLKPFWSPWQMPQGWVLAALMALLVWCVVETRALIRSAPRVATWRSLALAPRYSLPAAGAVLGLAGGLLYSVEGAWTYTNYLRGSLASLRGHGPSPAAFHGLLVLALLAGMGLSARQRGGFRPRLQLNGVWRQRLAGGLCMGIGGALLPGGNDTLLLGAIPALSLQGVIAYAALLAGVAAALTVLVAARGDRVASG
jgi:uncharacterized membrane protein YedE/YeeE